jgi:polyhydroxybutyrate depolymerase
VIAASQANSSSPVVDATCADDEDAWERDRREERPVDEDEYFTGRSQFAGAHNFIVAYPNAQRYPTGSGIRTRRAPPTSLCLRHVVAYVTSGWCVDPQHIYADGWSNGAVMRQRVACDAADLFAAATSYAGGRTKPTPTAPPTPTTAGPAPRCSPEW